MFNLKSLSSSFQKSSIKVVASNSFVNAMSELNQVKQKSQNNEDDLDLDYQFSLNTGISFLKNFVDTLTEDSFKTAAEHFAEASKIKSNRAEPYFYLAWLFNVADENELAIKYLKAARMLKPDLTGLNELSEQITLSLSQEPITKKVPVLANNISSTNSATSPRPVRSIRRL